MFDQKVSFYDIDAFKNGRNPITYIYKDDNLESIYKLNNSSKLFKFDSRCYSTDLGFEYYDLKSNP